MAYFIKLTHSYGPKNRLQDAALTVARSLDNYQVELPEDLTHFVEDRITRMNRSFNRCRALTVTLSKFPPQNDYRLYISDLVTLTLYKSKGPFTAEASQSSGLLEAGNTQATGPQLDLFANA